MAFTKAPQPDPLATYTYEVLTASNVIQTLDATGGTMYQVFIDNRLNAGFACYLKIFSGPTGTGANQTNTATDGTGIYAGGATAAVATIVCHADIATDDTVTIISADATSRTYTAKAASNYGANEFDASGDADATATALTAAINHDGGHDGKLVAVASTATITITNATAGTSGNTTITNNLNVAATVTSFSGGADISYVTSGLQEPNFIFVCNGGLTAEYHFPDGLVYADTLRACVVSTPGKAGTTAMSNNVAYRISVTT